ncbi:hypothetical protein OOZ54_21780 [Rhodopseudomonas palustris]|uniref:hypothetical protein n=1 Tax=Rhodopseudomonas palustris TaxID=1076 RepID=UPI0022F0EBD3|nr:hypothetical protein [Rhodopseudomonas palustris]WBU29266.1 hypothetical protein OOZ54_21780 [Rhodopseudomonas palustris]
MGWFAEIDGGYGDCRSRRQPCGGVTGVNHLKIGTSSPLWRRPEGSSASEVDDVPELLRSHHHHQMWMDAKVSFAAVQ